MTHVYIVEREDGSRHLVQADTHTVMYDSQKVVFYRDGRYVSHYERWLSFTRCELVPVETHVRTEKAS